MSSNPLGRPMAMAAANPQKVKVTMMALLRTGVFGPLTLGATRDSVRLALGEPESVPGAANRARTPDLWKYGAFEFRFSVRTGTLDRIRAERFDRLHAGPGIELDPWWMSPEATLEQVQRAFGDFGIPLESQIWPYTDNTVRYRAGAGVTLIFQQQLPQKFLGLIFAA